MMATKMRKRRPAHGHLPTSIPCSLTMLGVIALWLGITAVRTPAENGPIQFADVTARAGLSGYHNLFGSPEKRYIIESTDRKSTRLNSSHGYISYAVFCLKKKTPC